MGRCSALGTWGAAGGDDGAAAGGPGTSSTSGAGGRAIGLLGQVLRAAVLQAADRARGNRATRRDCRVWLADDGPKTLEFEPAIARYIGSPFKGPTGSSVSALPHLGHSGGPGSKPCAVWPLLHRGSTTATQAPVPLSSPAGHAISGA